MKHLEFKSSCENSKKEKEDTSGIEKKRIYLAFY